MHISTVIRDLAPGRCRARKRFQVAPPRGDSFSHSVSPHGALSLRCALTRRPESTAAAEEESNRGSLLFYSTGLYFIGFDYVALYWILFSKIKFNAIGLCEMCYSDYIFSCLFNYI